MKLQVNTRAGYIETTPKKEEDVEPLLPAGQFIEDDSPQINSDENKVLPLYPIGINPK